MMTSPGRQGGAEEVILSSIRLLSDSLIDRIAAGEVVERPASIVKELVENSLDAGARTIHVLLRGGGKARIEVRDDGVGMGREDAQMALERHATSKLRDLSDLDAIGTLGFRGEALSSIAAVSELTLSTATKSGEGTQVEVHGGRNQGVSEVAHPAGTTIRVDRLFYNVPARRKFLRSDPTEVAHAVRWLTRYALAHPERGFHLQHGDRQLLDTEPAIADVAVDVAYTSTGAAPDVRVAAEAGPGDAARGSVEFENVWFTYTEAGDLADDDDRWVLRDVSFRVEAGGKIA